MRGATTPGPGRGGGGGGGTQLLPKKPREIRFESRVL